MALVKYGAGIVQISGSIAGDVHARNASGNYIRPRTKPTNPNTAPQVRARSILSFLTEYWNSDLSAAQRTAWGTYAANVAMKNRLGETIHLSGFNHFIRSNSVRKWHGNVISGDEAQRTIKDGPVIFTLPDKDPTVSVDLDVSPHQIAITFDIARDWCTESFAFMCMRQGLPQNPTRNFYAGPWTSCLIILGNPGGLVSPLNMLPFHPLAIGQRCWCSFRISRFDGRLSDMFYANAIVHGQLPGEVPNLLGQTQAAAEELLAAAALVLGEVTTEHSDTVPVDLIISSDPVAHTRLNPGDPVNIVISLGPAE